MSTIIYCTRKEEYQGKYIVIDFYEGTEVLVQGVTLKNAKKAKDTRFEDTDGECDVEIFRMVYNPSYCGRLVVVESY